MGSNLYATLGVPRSASQDAVKKAAEPGGEGAASPSFVRDVPKGPMPANETLADSLSGFQVPEFFA